MQYINAKELRESVNFSKLLQHHGVEIKDKGRGQHQGFCPLPNHQGEGKSPSFSANLERGIFQCFGCGGKGNSIDFDILMHKEDPKDGKAFRRSALRLQKMFQSPTEDPPSKVKKQPSIKKTPTDQDKALKEKSPEPDRNPEATVIINCPLQFELKGLEPGHRYLKKRGFPTEVAESFGAGYCKRGLMSGRIAIPIYNREKELIGYAGRLTSEPDKDNPKYRFPGIRQKEGIYYEFHKSEVLYESLLPEDPMSTLVVVEGFFHTWRLRQAGVSSVSTMGASLSDTQLERIIEITNEDTIVLIIPDDDVTGKRFLESVLAIARHRSVRIIDMTKGRDIADLKIKKVKALF